MYTIIRTFSGRLRWLFFGSAVLLAVLLLCSLLPTPSGTGTRTAAASPDIDSFSTSDSPNAVTNALAVSADRIGAAIAASGGAAESGGRMLQTVASSSGKATAHGLYTTASFAGRGLATGATAVARSVGSGVAAIIYAPSQLLGLATDAPIVSAVIRPSDSATVPTIDTSHPARLAASIKPPAADIATVAAVPASTSASVGAWPLHGEITTLFGVPELPYQAIHTGLDISDGQRAGVTPVESFRAGRVVQVVRSNLGLGNHVVVDHGGGVTSVYGHLYSVSVDEGQQVDQQTVLGYEGSTGVSTGTHLHFEIRINGQPVDPHQLIDGQP